MAIADAAGSKRLSLYLLMGQSNMSGRGRLEAIDHRTHSRILMLDAQLRWQPASELGRRFAEAMLSLIEIPDEQLKSSISVG